MPVGIRELSESAQDGIRLIFGPDDDEDDGDEEDEPEPIALGIEGIAEADESEWDSPHELDFEWQDHSIRVDDEEVSETDDRDEKIADYGGSSPHRKVRQHVRDQGVASDLKDTLEEIATEEHESVAAEGDVLDMRNVVRRLAGDTTVDEYYRRPTTRPSDDLAIGVSIDMSGSMASYELEAKSALGAFLFAVDQLGGTVVANAWQHRFGAIKIQMLTAPGERFRWRHLDAVEPGGGDPIARGMRSCGDLLQRTTASEQLLFVISDGKPTVESLRHQSYDSPIDEADHVATELRSQGVTVVGVGFGRVREQNLVSMFGEKHSVHVDLEDLAEELADVLLSELGRPGHGVIA